MTLDLKLLKQNLNRSYWDDGATAIVYEQAGLLMEALAAMTAARDELAKIAAAREHPDHFPDFDVSLERIAVLRKVGGP